MLIDRHLDSISRRKKRAKGNEKGRDGEEERVEVGRETEEVLSC